MLLRFCKIQNFVFRCSQKHQFLRQNRDVNDGENFPGDYLSAIFDDIQAKELRENTSRSVARARARSPARRVHNAAQERSAVLFREPGRLGAFPCDP